MFTRREICLKKNYPVPRIGWFQRPEFVLHQNPFHSQHQSIFLIPFALHSTSFCVASCLSAHGSRTFGGALCWGPRHTPYCGLSKKGRLPSLLSPPSWGISPSKVLRARQAKLLENLRPWHWARPVTQLHVFTIHFFTLHYRKKAGEVMTPPRLFSDYVENNSGQNSQFTLNFGTSRKYQLYFLLNNAKFVQLEGIGRVGHRNTTQSVSAAWRVASRHYFS